MDDKKKLVEPMIFDEDRSGSSFIPNKSNKSNELVRPMEFDVRTKSFEEKLYIILYKLDNDDDIYDYIYSLCIGRTEAYNDIKNKLQSLGAEVVDIHRSKVITETKQTESESGDRKYYLIPYEESASVYAFCKNVEEYYSGDTFNIEEYNNSDIPENPASLLENKPGYMTAEQLAYKAMLEQSMKRDKFFETMRKELADNNDSNI